MKKITVFLTALIVLFTAASCGKQDSQASQDSAVSSAAESSEAAVVQSAEPSVLQNHMTQAELDRADKHALTLLDEPADAEHEVSVEKRYVSPEEELAYIEEKKADGQISQKDYDSVREEAEAARDAGEQLEYIGVVLIDGCYYTELIPSEDYDGGELNIISTEPEMDENGEFVLDENGEVIYNTVQKHFDTQEEYFDSLETDFQKKQARLVFEAVRNKTYTVLPEGTVDFENPSETLFLDPFADNRSVWELDRDAVAAISDSIDEYSIYDEEMQVEFLVHVTLPPDYDPEKTYPMMLLTDAVWRFGNVPDMRKCMENGEVAPVILATLGYNYRIDGTNEYYRFTHLVEKRDMLQDFITDNLMPYLCEQYHIDCADSTLYGHSDGGVFVHSVLFNSDRYENQPFGRYIIGSPAFFGLYDESDDDLRIEEALSDYGYFDRNDTLNKRVWLTGGSQEDPDYESLYRGHDTTLEGLAHLRDRIDAHSSDYVYKLYESHHYQYIPDMLTEYLKSEYPA